VAKALYRRPVGRPHKAVSAVRFPKAFLVRLTEEDYAALAEKAQANDRTLAAEVRRSIARYLKRPS